MEYLSLTEAASKLNVSRQWLWVLIQMGRVKAERIGNAWVIKNDSLKIEKPKAN